MTGGVTHGIMRWVLIGMCGMEARGVARGVARAALAACSRWDGDCRRCWTPGIGAAVHGCGGIIRVRFQMGTLRDGAGAVGMGGSIGLGAGNDGMLSATLGELVSAGVAGMEAGRKGMISANCRELASAWGAGTKGAPTLAAGLHGVMSSTPRDAAGDSVG